VKEKNLFHPLLQRHDLEDSKPVFCFLWGLGVEAVCQGRWWEDSSSLWSPGSSRAVVGMECGTVRRVGGHLPHTLDIDGKGDVASTFSNPWLHTGLDASFQSFFCLLGRIE
jgi:hypothetical protein